MKDLFALVAVMAVAVGGFLMMVALTVAPMAVIGYAVYKAAELFAGK